MALDGVERSGDWTQLSFPPQFDEHQRKCHAKEDQDHYHGAGGVGLVVAAQHAHAIYQQDEREEADTHIAAGLEIQVALGQL